MKTKFLILKCTTVVILLTLVLFHSHANAQQDLGTLVYESEDGRFRYILDARLQIDVAFYDQNKNDLSSGTELRRGRMAIKTRLWRDWNAELDIDFADNETEVKDAWLAYNRLGSNYYIKVGQFKEPFSLEYIASSNDITFMERGLPRVFRPGRNIGAGFTIWGDQWQFASGIFGQEIGDNEDKDVSEDEGNGFTGRLTFAPVLEEDVVLHLGAAASYRNPDAEEDVNNQNTFRFRQRPESHVDRRRFLNTGRITNSKNLTVYGVEAAAVYGPFSLQGEYMGAHVDRKAGNPNANFHGAYIFGSWFLTGESRPYVCCGLYRDAEFGRIFPRNRIGAWEVAARYSMVDLTDGPIKGGKERNVTFGLNWYVNPNIRITANYVIVDLDKNADDDGDAIGNDEFETFQMRFQAIF